MSKRKLLTHVFVFSVLVIGMSCRSKTPPSSSPDHPRVRDKFYVWTHPAGSHDGYYLAPHTSVKSRMTPVEGARYLDVPNLYFIQYGDKPALPEYRKYAISFRSMNEVIWSLTGLAGKTSKEMRAHVLELAAEFPNITGFILDDFLKWGEERKHEKIPHWVAENNVDFPVTLTFTPPEPIACDKVEIVQSEWPTEDYRTKDVVVKVTNNGSESEVGHETIPNTGAAVATIEVSRGEIEELKIEILSTHDTDKAKSCGLREVRLWNQGKRLSTDKWKATASSTYPSKAHAPEFVFMDEWPSKPKKPVSGELKPVGASLTPEELRALRDETVINGKRLPIICGIYENQISPRVMPHLKHVDKVALWTWIGADLVDLEENFEKLEQLVSPMPIILGCYLYDYGATKPMSVGQMQHQCELGLKWLKEGRIDGMIFLASNICDQQLDAVEWTREWIAKVGDDPL